jgi:hypothetical protein
MAPARKQIRGPGGDNIPRIVRFETQVIGGQTLGCHDYFVDAGHICDADGTIYVISSRPGIVRRILSFAKLNSDRCAQAGHGHSRGFG